MTDSLKEKLIAYVENRLDPETEIEMDGLILLYVDGDLDSERAAGIEAVMNSHSAVETSITRSMRAAKTVQEHLFPASEAIELPPDPVLERSLAEMIADPNAWGKEPEGEDNGSA